MPLSAIPPHICYMPRTSEPYIPEQVVLLPCMSYTWGETTPSIQRFGS